MKLLVAIVVAIAPVLNCLLLFLPRCPCRGAPFFLMALAMIKGGRPVGFATSSPPKKNLDLPQASDGQWLMLQGKSLLSQDIVEKSCG